MTKAWLTYFSLRVGIFVAAFLLFSWLGIDGILAALFAAVIGLAISLLFLGKQRDQVSIAIYERSKNKNGEDAEDNLLDKNAE
jgi:hypothetical protein